MSSFYTVKCCPGQCERLSFGLGGVFVELNLRLEKYEWIRYVCGRV